MGEIKINIPKDIEAKLADMFPGENTAEALLRLAKVALQSQAGNGQAPTPRQSLLEMAAAIRASLPKISDENIRRLREEGRH